MTKTNIKSFDMDISILIICYAILIFFNVFTMSSSLYLHYFFIPFSYSALTVSVPYIGYYNGKDSYLKTNYSAFVTPVLCNNHFRYLNMKLILVCEICNQEKHSRDS